jgi:hypothetical protein
MTSLQNRLLEAHARGINRLGRPYTEAVDSTDA